jgi:hypothetical protein
VNRHQVLREEDGALLGYVDPVGDGLWRPLTVFGYPLAAPASADEALEEVRRGGLERMTGNWWFRSAADGEWYRCVILEAEAERVRVRPHDHRYPGTEYALTIDRPLADLSPTEPPQPPAGEDLAEARPLG